MKHCLLLVMTMTLVAATAEAQFGDLGHSAPTSPAQQDAINKATDFLTSVGEDLSGITVTNAELVGNLPSAFDPNTNTLGIDFDRLNEVVPPNTPGAPGHPGTVAVCMFHELQHARHGWGRGTCDEFALTAYVASQECALICFMLTNGLGPLDALCLQYSHVQDVFNDPAQQSKMQEEGCADTQIPPCGCC